MKFWNKYRAKEPWFTGKNCDTIEKAVMLNEKNYGIMKKNCGTKPKTIEIWFTMWKNDDTMEKIIVNNRNYSYNRNYCSSWSTALPMTCRPTEYAPLKKKRGGVKKTTNINTI